MNVFRCTYRDPSGKVVSERLEAESQTQVVEALSARGFMILSIIEEPASVRSRWKRPKRVKNVKSYI